MVAEHRIKPGFVEQSEHPKRIRATIRQVAHGKQPVAGGIETDGLKAGIEKSAATVQVADDEIAAKRIGRQAAQPHNSTAKAGSKSLTDSVPT